MAFAVPQAALREAGTVRPAGHSAGHVCARALYCVFHLSDFWETYETPWMLRFFDGGLAMPGLLAGLALAAVISARLVKARPPLCWI